MQKSHFLHPFPPQNAFRFSLPSPKVVYRYTQKSVDVNSTSAYYTAVILSKKE